MSSLHGIYSTRLKKGNHPFAIKIGISGKPERRARVKNQKSCDFAEPDGEPEIAYGAKSTVQALETELKNRLKMYRVKTDVGATEIFPLEFWDKIIWAIRHCLISPEDTNALVWRAANDVLDLSIAPEVVLFKLDTHRWECNPDPCITHQINLILERRFEKFTFSCQTLDQSHAKNVLVKDTPEHVTVTYRIDFSIDPDPVLAGPCWRKCRFTVMRFIPTEKLGIEKARSADLRLPGFDRFSVRFTEKLSKRTGVQERSATAISGRRLDKELEAELLEAEFVDV